MKNDGITIVLGPEWDDALRSSLLDVLRELGATEVSREWGVGGSQEIETLVVKLGDQVLSIEAETYIGLSVTGPRDLVERVQSMMRR